ncbi:MAG: glycoside hydrolase family 31 protein [Alphaproteobacteria bacterium]
MIDFSEFSRLESLTTTHPGSFKTDTGQDLTVSAIAPGVFRLRFGPQTKPDYKLLLAPLPSLPLKANQKDNIFSLRAGTNARLEVIQNPLRLRLFQRNRLILESILDEHFRGWTRLPCFGHNKNQWTAAFALTEGEAVYGLGEKFSSLNRRNQLVVSRAEDALGVNTELSYKNIPFCWSPRGWGVFVHTPGRVTHGVGYPQWSHRSYGLVVDDEALDLFLFAADAPAEILNALTSLTGRPAVPPPWSLGVWVSRAYYQTADQALAIAREIRDRRIPCDVLTLDGRAWLEVKTRFAFEWDASRYPDPKATLSQIKAQHFKVCCWEYPLVSIHNPLFEELAKKGWLLKTESGEAYRYAWDVDPKSSPFGSVLTPLPVSGIFDFTHPEAYGWWQDQHKALFEVGVDVMKTDFGEQVPDDAVAHNGDTGERLHNVYPLLYNACVFEAMAKHGKEPIVWGRDGWTGSQRYPVQWGGDPQSDWGGLAASIRGGLSWGLSGVPCYATDVGGFYGKEQPNAELYLRWVAQGIFSSHFRFHGIGLREPWHFGPDAEVMARQLLEFRYRLIPYIHAVLKDAAQTGLPAMRAMPLAFPQDKIAHGFDTQYMFGPSLLVAPITAPGGQVDIWLPDGLWYDIWTGEPYEGAGLLTIEDIPLDRIPVFGREGTVLSLGPVVQHTGEINPKRPIEECWIFGAPKEDAIPSPGYKITHRQFGRKAPRR